MRYYNNERIEDLFKLLEVYNIDKNNGWPWLDETIDQNKIYGMENNIPCKDVLPIFRQQDIPRNGTYFVNEAMKNRLYWEMIYILD